MKILQFKLYKKPRFSVSNPVT